jgi:acetolactate synthase-1/3 small subunit
MTGELAIVTVRSDRGRRAEMVNMVSLLGLTLTDIRDDSLSVMAAGSAKSVQMAISALKPFGILAMARTGLVALSRPNDLGQGEEEDD